MINELRTAVKDWIESRCPNNTSVYYDYIPEYDSENVGISFIITGLEVVPTIDNSITLGNTSVQLYVNSRYRSDIDTAIDALLDYNNIPSGSIIQHIFYESFKDIEYEPSENYYYASQLDLRMNFKIYNG